MAGKNGSPAVELDVGDRTVPDRFASLGDLHAGIDHAVFSLVPLLECAERDEREGAKDPGGDD